MSGSEAGGETPYRHRVESCNSKNEQNAMTDHDHNWDAARHEASHVAMRHHRGLPPTRVYIENGVGYSEGSDTRISVEDALLNSLAGVAFERSINPTRPIPVEDDIEEEEENADVSGDSESDQVSAWRLIERNDSLRTAFEIDSSGTKLIPVSQSVPEAFARYLSRAASILERLKQLVETIAVELYEQQELSAHRVATICREWEEKFCSQTDHGDRSDAGNAV